MTSQSDVNEEDITNQKDYEYEYLDKTKELYFLSAGQEQMELDTCKKHFYIVSLE